MPAPGRNGARADSPSARVCLHMGTQGALNGLVQGLIDLVLSGSIGFFVVPFITLYSIIRFLRWALSTSRGSPDAGDLHDQAGELRRRADAAPDRAQRAFRRRY